MKYKEQIGYIVIREDLNDSLIKSQVRDVIERINRMEKPFKVKLLWFYRVDQLIRPGCLRLIDLKKELLDSNIEASFFPFISLRFPLRPASLVFVLPQLIFGLAIFRVVHGIKKFHSRSYHAGLLCSVCSRILRFQFVFDPRSPFPEEKVNSGAWRMGSFSFRFWKSMEKIIIRNSEATLLTSMRLRETYLEEFVDNKFYCIPNNYPVSFDVLDDAVMTQTRQLYHFVYLGSFGHWNRIEEYLRFYNVISSHINHPLSFLIITPKKNHSEVFQLCGLLGVNTANIEVKEARQSEVRELLSKCKFGLYFMSNIDQRLGVKVVEYLRSGVKLIVSDCILGASDLVRQYKLGLIVDDDFKNIDEVLEILDKSGLQSLTCPDAELMQFAKENFSSARIADQIAEMYSRAFK